MEYVCDEFCDWWLQVPVDILPHFPIADEVFGIELWCCEEIKVSLKPKKETQSEGLPCFSISWFGFGRIIGTENDSALLLLAKNKG